MGDAWAELERSVHAALETYSNVHRGSGHGSLVSTRLYERAREIVLEHLGLQARDHVVVFATPRRAQRLASLLPPGRWRGLSSTDIGLPLGVRALAIERRALPPGAPLESGGGTARLVAADWVVWAQPPDRFEAGTPSIVNVLAFARGLEIVRQQADAFREAPAEPVPSDPLESLGERELLRALRQTLIGRDLPVPVLAGDARYIHFDNAASTRTFGAVWDAVRRAWRSRDDRIVRQTERIVNDFVGAPLGDVVFTSNTTEAIGLVAGSLGKGTLVVNTLLEHNSNELPWRLVPGCRLVRVSVDAEGIVDLDQLESALSGATEETRLVAVSGASNVLGTFNDLPRIACIARRHGARLLVDAAQLVAHRPIDMEASGIDYLCFSAHKAYAPFGTGVLVARQGLLPFEPDELARIRASGAENLGGVAALGEALTLLRRIGWTEIIDEERRLTAGVVRGLSGIPGLRLHGVGGDSPRFAQRGGVIAFDIKGRMPSRVARALAEGGGIAVRSGCHCAHMLIKRLVGVPPWAERIQKLIVTLFPRFELPGVVRVSLGLENTDEDVERLVSTLRALTSGQLPARGHLPKRLESFVTERAERVYAP